MKKSGKKSNSKEISWPTEEQLKADS